MQIKTLFLLNGVLGVIWSPWGWAQEVYSFTQTITHPHLLIPMPYRVFTGNGIEQDLDHIIATVSYFTLSEKDGYRFMENKEYPISLEGEKNTVTDRVHHLEIAAVGIALEMIGYDANLGGMIKPRKRITPLNDFIFDFGENVSPRGMDLILETKSNGDLGGQLKLELPNGNEKMHEVTSDIKDIHLLDSKHASVTTVLSTATATSAFNVFWENYLNEKLIHEQDKQSH